MNKRKRSAKEKCSCQVDGDSCTYTFIQKRELIAASIT